MDPRFENMNIKYDGMHPKIDKLLTSLEQASSDTLEDINKLIHDILTKTMIIKGRFTTLPEYGNLYARVRLYELMRNLTKKKRVFGSLKKQHWDSGFDEVCTQILYIPGIGQSYMEAQESFKSYSVILDVQ